MSLVNAEKLRKDPRKLAYLYPKMPVIRYKELTEEYHRGITLRAVERVAEMFGCVLIPAPCVHHARRRPERRIMIYGRNYYVFEKDDVTPLEWAKYLSMCGEGVEHDGTGTDA